ncbi:hypothetical protein [Actinokineospora sp. HUAS TT18]
MVDLRTACAPRRTDADVAAVEVVFAADPATDRGPVGVPPRRQPTTPGR